MPDKKIGIGVEAKGTAEFKRRMDEAANAVKVLDSEEKLAEAQFRSTGNAQQYAAEKARILKEMMDEQQKAVDAAKAAVDKLKSDGINPNSRAMQTWNTRLNTAKTRLINMQTELNKNETELGEQQQAVDGVSASFTSLGETAESIDNSIKLDQAIKAVDWLKEKIETVIRTAARAAKFVWDMEAEGGKWANELNKAATKAGLDVETYQSWQYASLFIETSVDQIVAARSKLAEELGSTSEETVKAFNEIGVATRNVDGSVRDSTDVLFDTIDALARYTDQTEREIHAQKVLGGSWKDLNPLIEAGAAAYKAMAQQGMETAVVSAENVQLLQGVDDANQRLAATLEKTKFTLLASLAEPFTKAAEAIDGALTKFNEFLETEEGKAALKEVSDSLTGIIKSVTEKDFSGVVNTAKEAVKKFTGALGWIKDHGSEVATAIEGLFKAWAGLKLTGDVLRFIQGVEAFKGLLGKGGSTAKGAAANAAQSAVGTAPAGSGAASAAGAAGSAAGGFASILGSAAALYAQYKAWDWAISRRKGDQSALVDTQEHVWAAADGNDQLYTALADMVHAQKQLEDSFAEYANGNLSEEDYISIIDRANALAETFHAMEGSGKLWDAWQSWREGNAISDWIMPEDQAAKMEEAGQQAGDSFAKGLEDKAQDAVDAAAEMAQDATEEVEQEMSFLDVIGANGGQGLANGLRSKYGEVVAAASELAQAVTATLTGAMQIASPSKVMARLGGFVAQGFAQGMEDQISAVERATSRMVETAARAPVSAGRRPAAADKQAGGGDINAYIVMDKQVVGQLVAPAVDGYIGAQMQTRR